MKSERQIDRYDCGQDGVHQLRTTIKTRNIAGREATTPVS